MKAESRIFLFLTIFFLVVTPIYAYMTYQASPNGMVEPIGTTVFALTLLFCLMIWATFAITGHTLSRHNATPRPEDRKDAEVIDGAGTVGFFPPSSLVPFWTTCAVALVGLGPVFGWWISLIGVAFGIWCVFGWAYEYYRGDFKH